MPAVEMRFYSLLHLSDSDPLPINSKISNSSDRVRILCRVAYTLGRSLLAHGHRLTVFTNAAAVIERQLSEFGGPNFDMQEIEFESSVPPGTRFYSAHFKFACFHEFARAESGVHFLIDLDIICLRPIPEEIARVCMADGFAVYDISTQVAPAVGWGKVQRDLRSLNGISGEQSWFGGEFIGATPASFRRLYSLIREMMSDYATRLPEFHHIGDELLTSAALNALRQRGTHLYDAGVGGSVRRHWSVRTKHEQAALKLGTLPSLLHLPADKDFLAGLASSPPDDLLRFEHRYRRNARRKKIGLPSDSGIGDSIKILLSRLWPRDSGSL